MNEQAPSPIPYSGLRDALQIACIALLIRLLVARLAFWNANPVLVLWPRGIEVLAIAKSLVTGYGFSSPFGVYTGPTAFMPPVYPTMLAAVEKYLGIATTASAWTIVVLQSVFSALTCIPVYMLARRFSGNASARLAAWLWAVLPYNAIIPSNIIWETSLSALMASTGLVLVFRAIEQPGTWRWILAGGFWGLATLTNASLLLLFPAYCLFGCVPLMRPANWRPILIGMTAFAMLLIPWLIRNAVVMHKFVPVRSNFALELWLGNRAGTTPGFHPEVHPAFSTAEVNHFATVGELAYMAEKRDATLAYVRAHPKVFLANTAVRILAFWSGRGSGLLYGVALLNVCGLLGLCLLWRQSRYYALFFGLAMLVYPLPFYITHAEIRYQHPIQPLLTVLAAFLLWSKLKMNTSRTPLRSVVVP